MKDIYSDFDIEFNLNKRTKDINIRRDADSIRQSIWNLLQTNYYDRKWHPEIGSYFPKMLFSLAHPELYYMLEDQITQLLRNHEPRISLSSVRVFSETQYDADKGVVTVEITYSTMELGTDTATFHLERTR